MNRKLRRGLALMILVLGTAFIFAACTRKAARTGGWALENKQHATLADYKGKVVVLDFYATWCEPCRAETPRLVQLQEQYQPQGLQVIGLNVGGADDRDQVPAFAREFGIQYPLAFPDDEFADSFLGDNQNIPQAFVFDRNGELVKRFIGYSDSSGAEFERVVKASLAAGQ
ncbi:MAG TPA: TlpA disulfide reductase family protein [Pyrinomonadaceae bacterium]|nr:TlpA disulfide reductase family protein [Pyrinomonadaceae bacterium]